MMATAMQTSGGASAAVKTAVGAYRIAVVIVHYKTPQMLLECIESLLPQVRSTGFSLQADHQAKACTACDRADHIFVVDNASEEEHLAPLQKLTNNPAVTMIVSDKNLGFAGANNLAITHVQQTAGAEYFLLLNPDTILRPNAIDTLVEFLDKHPQAACVGPRLEDPDATPQQSAFSDPSPISEFLRGASIGPIERILKRWHVHGPIINTPQPTDWLAGACVLMRSEMIQKAGLLDDRFFMYYEEVDYFRRARKLGFQAWYEPNARVVHLVGQSSGVNILPGQKRLPSYWFESRHRYFRKHYGWLGTLLADWFWLNGHMLDRLRKLLTGTSHAAPARHEGRDLLHHSLNQLLHPFKTSPRAGRGVL